MEGDFWHELVRWSGVCSSDNGVCVIGAGA